MALSRTDFPYRVPLVSQFGKVAEAVTNGYVALDLLPAGFHTNVKAGGVDIRMTTDDGLTEVAREVVYYDAGTDAGELHFDTTGISTSEGVTWYLNYGNAAASDYAEDDTYGREAVWDADYVLVVHATEDPSGDAPQVLDSTSNDNDGTSAGTMVTGDLVDADVGKGLEFEKAKEQWIDFGLPAEITAVGDKSYTLILKGIHQAPTEYLLYNYRVGMITTGGPLGGNILSMCAFDGSWKQPGWDASGLADVFHSIHGVVDTGTNIKLYVDADLKNTDTLGTVQNNNDVVRLATNGAAVAADTIITEARIFNGVRSADYITTEHNNLLDVANFWSIGAEEEYSPPVDVIGPIQPGRSGLHIGGD